jgi:hypothetical protein
MALRPRYSDRGPTSSKVENERIREHMTELNELYYEVNEAMSKLNNTVFIGNAESSALNARITALNNEIAALENTGAAEIVLNSNESTVAMKEGFPADPLDEFLVNPLFLDTAAGVITLPQGSKTQKLRFVVNGQSYVNPEVNSNFTATIDGAAPQTTTDEEFAFDGDLSTAFYVESTTASNKNGTLTFFVTVPSNAGNVKDVNQITIYPMPSAAMTLQEIQYSSLTSSPIEDDATNGVWNDLNGWISNDINYINDYRAPVEGQALSYKTYLPMTRYYIKRNPSDGSRYTSFRLKFYSNAITYTDIYKVILGIRQLDLSTVVYGPAGTIWYKYTVPVGGAFILNDIRARVVNTEVVGIYSPTITTHIVSGGEIVDTAYGASYNDGDTLYIKMQMDDGGSGDTPVVAGLVLDITRV